MCEGCAEHQCPVTPGIVQPLGQDPPRGCPSSSQLLSGASVGGSAHSGGFWAAHAERDNELLGGVVGVRPANGEDAVWFVVVVFGCERVVCGLLLKVHGRAERPIFGRLWIVVVVCEGREGERIFFLQAGACPTQGTC